MSTASRIKDNHRSRFSKAKSLLGAGLGATLMLAGVTLVGVLPAAATTAALTFSQEPQSTVVAGATLTSFSVTITSGGSPTDHIVISDSSCSFSGGSTLSVAATSSVATFSNVVITTGTSCTLTATDSDSGGTQTSTPITVTPAAASKLIFTTPPPATASDNVALTLFKVSTEDQYGNTVTSGSGSADTISIASSCALGGTVSTTEAAGVASFSALTINQVGSCPLIATDTTSGDTGLTPATSSAITVSGGAPAKVVYTVAPPTSVLTTGTVITAFKVGVEDASGNVDTTGTGSTDLITLSSPCLAASVNGTAVAGLATFSTVAFATTGACVLTATDASRVIAAATASVQVGQPQTTLAITSTSGYLDAPLTIAVSGGSGTGAVTFIVTNGTATGCTITNGVLSATSGGTCIVTATKAASAPYAVATTSATTITISSAPKALRVAGVITLGKTAHVTVTGFNFSGRPKVISNAAGFKATVTRDTGKSLSLTITVTGANKLGVKVLSLVFANGKRASVKYSLH